MTVLNLIFSFDLHLCHGYTDDRGMIATDSKNAFTFTFTADHADDTLRMR